MTSRSELARLDDSGLEFLARRLESKIGALRFATTALGTRLLERYAEQLDAVRAEIERRWTT